MLTFGIPKQSKMYIVVEKTSKKSAIFKEKRALGEYINASVDTIRRKRGEDCWEWKNFIIYLPSIVKIKSSRGGFRRKKEENW